MSLRTLTVVFFYFAFLCCKSNAEDASNTTLDPSSENSTSAEDLPINSDCFYEMQLRDELLFKGQLNRDVNNKLFLTAELVYDNFGWIGFGITDKNRAVMAGSQAIIGVLGEDEMEAEPIMYSMTRTSRSGVIPMEEEYQTLFDHKIEETEISTILSFSKYVDEPFHHAMNFSEPVVFLYALAFTHDLRPHPYYGVFKVDFNEACVPSLQEQDIRIDSSLAEFQDALRLHGILASLAWAIAVPFAILSIMFRDKFSNPKTCFKSHFYLNVITILFTIGAFVIVMMVFKKSKRLNFSKPHHIIGMILLIFCMIQFISGILRPSSGSAKKTKMAKCS